MSGLWVSAGESGILRKNDPKEKYEDLLVFGYACKLFRDDEKALAIDQGKQLIPWMGDNSLKIDRYDGRGTLADVTPYEASKEGYDTMRWLGLSESERRIEQLCDEERYLALNTNEEDDEMYKEEELKRGQSQNQVQYSYEETPKPAGPSLPPEEDDEPYKPSPELDIPVNMTLPATVKQNARIEKTALFISKEGPQMEILLKTKQASNPQFSFLTQDDPLYRYYRHILMAIKTGRYTVQSENSQTDQNDQKSEEDSYLHPSLASIPLTTIESSGVQPMVNYKPSADCAYSQLVNRIQGNQPTPETRATVQQTTTATPNNAQLFYNSLYLQHYQQYGYCSQYDPSNPYYGQYNQTNQYEQYQLQYGANKIKNDANPYAQIVSNVKGKLENEVKGAEITKTSSYDNYKENTAEIITKAPVLYNQNDNTSQQTTVQSQETAQPISALAQTVVPVLKQPLFALAQYSGSESEEDDDDNSDSTAQAVVIPPQDMQVIIDKMVTYVAKNGTDFEAIVRSKGDPRFGFLEGTHVFHPYYKYKLKACSGDSVVKKDDNKVESGEKKGVEVSKDTKQGEKIEKKPTKTKERKVITPVCFSIKKPRDSDSVSRDKSALPVEDSTDEDEQNKDENKTVTSQTEESSTSQSDQTENKNEKEGESCHIIEIEDPIMELIDLTDDLEERKDCKRAENRLKDKLATAAREKLAAKNRALQLERKKRAAAFLSQLKPSTTATATVTLATITTTTATTTTTQINNEITETKIVRPATPEEGEINSDPSQEDISRLVYQVDQSPPNGNEKEERSSRHRHKTSHHRKKSRKRSHSNTRKRKRDHKSHDRKRSKRRYRSRSSSPTKERHRKNDRKDEPSESDRDRHMPRRRNSENSSYTSNCESEANSK